MDNRLIKKMRDAQKAYNQNPTAENLDLMEDLEDEVDGQLDFEMNCHATTMREVKGWLKRNLYI